MAEREREGGGWRGGRDRQEGTGLLNDALLVLEKLTKSARINTTTCISGESTIDAYS